MNPNPFQPPARPTMAAEDLVSPDRSQFHFGWLNGLIWTYPVAFPASLIATWLVAWAHLGHVPRPMIDDPKSMGRVVSTFHTITIVMMCGVPGVAVTGFIFLLLQSGRTWLQRLSSTLAYSALWVLVVFIMRADPLLIGEWFMD